MASATVSSPKTSPQRLNRSFEVTITEARSQRAEISWKNRFVASGSKGR